VDQGSVGEHPVLRLCDQPVESTSKIQKKSGRGKYNYNNPEICWGADGAIIQEHIMSSYLPANAGIMEEDSWGIFAIPAINLGSGVSPRVFHRF
jgi:hypothetical protein